MPAQHAEHIAGACFSLLSAAVLVVFFSLMWPQNYDWKDMKFQTFDNIEDKVSIHTDHIDSCKHIRRPCPLYLPHDTLLKYIPCHVYMH